MAKKIAIVLLLVVLVVGGIGAYFFQQFTSDAFDGSETVELRINDNDKIKDVCDSLLALGLQRPDLFKVLAKRMNYRDDNLKSGLYEVSQDMNLIELIRHLRSGRQKPVNVIINSIRTIEQLAGKITANLEIDSLTFLNHVDSIGRTDTTMTRFIPNTYSVFWNIGAASLIERMDKERSKFWQAQNRKAKAADLLLTPTEVYILASIVEQESTLESEKPTIASVYLNRLERGIKLQADPTVVFANLDFSIRRVLNKHLALDSPYNTYLYEGLPPGPICMPSISSIDAVLNPSDTDYIFFCAKPGYQNGHAFASTLRQHNNNANTYREWLRNEGIR